MRTNLLPGRFTALFTHAASCQSNVTEFQDRLRLDDYLFKDFPKRSAYAVQQMTREEIEKKMDELARKYVEKRDSKIIDELYRLRLELKKLEKGGTNA
jgi:hypothetical protein